MFQNLPQWISQLIVDIPCPSCTKKMVIQGVKGIGIRESYQDKNNTVLFIIYNCQHCNDRTNIEIKPCKLDEFAALILNEMTDKDKYELTQSNQSEELPYESPQLDYDSQYGDESQKIEKPKKPVERSKITIKEIKEFKKSINSMSSEDFLRNLGVSDIDLGIENDG